MLSATVNSIWFFNKSYLIRIRYVIHANPTEHLLIQLGPRDAHM